MQHDETFMSDRQRVTRSIDTALVLAQFRLASEQLFRRQMSADTPAVPLGSALPGLEVSEASWAAWEALLKESER
jgi:hypothetical protein